MKNCVALNRSNPFFLRVSYGFDRKCSNLKPDATLKIHISLLNAHTHTQTSTDVLRFGCNSSGMSKTYVCRCDERYIRSTMDRMRYILDYADRQTDWPREVEGEWNDVTFWNEESQDINRTRQKPTKRKKKRSTIWCKSASQSEVYRWTLFLFSPLFVFVCFFLSFFNFTSAMQWSWSSFTNLISHALPLHSVDENGQQYEWMCRRNRKRKARKIARENKTMQNITMIRKNYTKRRRKIKETHTIRNHLNRWRHVWFFTLKPKQQRVGVQRPLVTVCVFAEANNK